MKYVTTKKAVISQYGDRIISVPYCALQSLLRFEDAQAYTSGTYGWGADVYDVNGVALVTGYRPFGKHVDRALIDRFERWAREELEAQYPRSWKITHAALHNLLVQFVKEATE